MFSRKKSPVPSHGEYMSPRPLVSRGIREISLDIKGCTAEGSLMLWYDDVVSRVVA